jgi:CRISPR-associated protein Csd2
VITAARGEMVVRGLWIFTHDSDKGNAPAHKLFKLIRVRRKDGVKSPRDIEDYEIDKPADGSLAEHPEAKYPGVDVKCLVEP